MRLEYQKPAVDGNVLRVVSRILASREDIMKAKVRTAIETALEEVIQKIVRETLIRD